MKKNLFFFGLLFFVSVVILSFKFSPKTNLKIQKASTISKAMKVATTNYSFRGIINSTTSSVMSISDNGAGTVTITTSNTSIQTGDKAIFVLDNSLSFGSNNTFSIPANSAQYWMVPFDANYSPIDLKNSQVVPTCFKWYCPCDPLQTATNACEPGSTFTNGQFVATCTPFNTPATCNQCTPYRMQVNCSDNSNLVALDLFKSAFLIRADTLKFNGQTYP